MSDFLAFLPVLVVGLSSVLLVLDFVSSGLSFTSSIFSSFLLSKTALDAFSTYLSLALPA